jgi:hypothetical protein
MKKSESSLLVQNAFLSDMATPAGDTTPKTVTIRICLPLVGGKGGFGALLRGGPGGARAKKVTKDDCRDLSGRRIRHARSEKELSEWVAHQDEREAAHKEAKLRRRELKKQGTAL